MKIFDSWVIYRRQSITGKDKRQWSNLGERHLEVRSIIECVKKFSDNVCQIFWRRLCYYNWKHDTLRCNFMICRESRITEARFWFFFFEENALKFSNMVPEVKLWNLWRTGVFIFNIWHIRVFCKFCWLT